MRQVKCSLLLLVATPAEEKGLKEAAAECQIPFEKVKAKESSLGTDYYDLGPIGNEAGVLALPPSRDDDDNLIMGSIGFFGTAARAMRLRVATGSQAIVQVGMAFGINPEMQKLGDVLVSTSLLPYDSRDIKPVRQSCGTCGANTSGFIADYQEVRREPARPALIELFRRESRRHDMLRGDPGRIPDFNVYLGGLLSGAARIHCGRYRTALATAVPPGRDLIVGGEMEGVGLLAASLSWADPIWCVVKGICDFAAENRDAVIKSARPRACRNAAFFLLSALLNDVGG